MHSLADTDVGSSKSDEIKCIEQKLTKEIADLKEDILEIIYQSKSNENVPTSSQASIKSRENTVNSTRDSLSSSSTNTPNGQNAPDDQMNLQPFKPIKNETGQRNKSRLEAEFDFQLNDVMNFFQQKSCRFSHKFYCADLQWAICVKPNLFATKTTPKSMDYFIFCEPCSNKLTKWHCNAYVELRLLSNLPNQTKVFSTKNCFKPNSSGCGTKIIWKMLVDPLNGFYQGDSITIQAYVQVFMDSKTN